jgi:hypothetical protein
MPADKGVGVAKRWATPIIAIPTADEAGEHSRRSGGNRHCDRSEAIQIANGNERLDRHAGLLPGSR